MRPIIRAAAVVAPHDGVVGRGTARTSAHKESRSARAAERQRCRFPAIASVGRDTRIDESHSHLDRQRPPEGDLQPYSGPIATPPAIFLRASLGPLHFRLL